VTSIRSQPKSIATRETMQTTDAAATGRRLSLVFVRDDRLPEERTGDKASHRLFHHYYEDLLM
jgi:hypothetical protein